MARAFVVDTAKAQQVGDRLTSIGRTIAAFPPGPRPRGPLGTGVLESAWSELERSFATARQDLSRSIDESARGFTALAKGAIGLDQRKAEEAAEVGKI